MVIDVSTAYGIYGSQSVDGAPLPEEICRLFRCVYVPRDKLADTCVARVVRKNSPSFYPGKTR